MLANFTSITNPRVFSGMRRTKSCQLMLNWFNGNQQWNKTCELSTMPYRPFTRSDSFAHGHDGEFRLVFRLFPTDFTLWFDSDWKQKMKKKLQHHCGRFGSRPTSRREMLQWCANGFGALALSTLSDRPSSALASGPWDPKPSHFKAPAKNVIFLYMDGGPSHVDTFDPKPLLDRDHGKPLPFHLPPATSAKPGRIGKILISPKSSNKGRQDLRIGAFCTEFK